jgi:hypothetical protein
VPQFFNGMVCWHYHLQWICGYVHVCKIIKQLFHAYWGNSIQLLTGSEDNSCCSRNQSITDFLIIPYHI